jgi:alpha-L-rhamnosidase
VLIELPYQIYRYTGDQQVLMENKDAIFHYLQYLKTKRNEEGLIGYGLCDWCETGKFSEGDADTPVEVTDTLVSIDMLRKSEFIFELVNEPERVNDCKSFREQLTTDFKKKYLGNDLVISCRTQTAQAKAIEVGLFTGTEKQQAVQRLVELIAEDGNRFKVGVIGARVLFRVLAENGYAELAYKLITQDGFPSYKYWLDHGATSLWEAFHEVQDGSLLRKDGGRMLSLNHHFWGDISAWFYRHILGIRVNPQDTDANYIEVYPCEIPDITYAEGKYENGNGSITVKWNRNGQGKPVIGVEATGSFRYEIKI